MTEPNSRLQSETEHSHTVDFGRTGTFTFKHRHVIPAETNVSSAYGTWRDHGHVVRVQILCGDGSAAMGWYTDNTTDLDDYEGQASPEEGRVPDGR